MTLTLRARIAGILALSLLMVGAPITQAGECASQPDFRIRKPGGTLKGDNIYNLTAAGQKLFAGNAPGTRRQFVLSVQNDGACIDHYHVKDLPGASVGSIETSFAVGWPAQDITDEILLESPTPYIFELAPGVVHYFRVYLTVPGDATPGDYEELTLRVISQSSFGFQDWVAYRVTVI